MTRWGIMTLVGARAVRPVHAPGGTHLEESRRLDADLLLALAVDRELARVPPARGAPEARGGRARWRAGRGRVHRAPYDPAPRRRAEPLAVSQRHRRAPARRARDRA